MFLILGRKHDKFGNYVQWWSNQTIATFENMTRCFVDQYDNYTIKGVPGHVSIKPKTLLKHPLIIIKRTGER